MDRRRNNVARHRVFMTRSVDQIRRDVESGSLDPLTQDSEQMNQNLLHLAVAANNFEVIRYLGTEWGGDLKALVSAADSIGKTPLHIACAVFGGDSEVVEYLLDVFHADTVVSLWPGTGYSAKSPIHVAISRNCVQLVDALVRRAVQGVSPRGVLESKDDSGLTPLLYACSSSYCTDVARHLVRWERPYGLNSQLSQPRDNVGRTALHLACHFRRHDRRFELVTELVKNYCDDIEAQDSTNMRPLHVAASTADLRLVRFLVAEAGADVNAKDGKALTPLHYACQADGTRDAELIRFLVERGAQTESADNDGKTPLHFASRVPHKCFLVQHLVEKTNTAVDSRDNFGNTSLHLACAAGNITVAKYLLGQHADANAENVYKEQPIHAACNDVHFDLLKELVNDYGACVNVVDRNGWTPLLRTCMRSVYIPRRLDCVRWLLERGAGVDARNKYGQTPLLLALANLHDEVAALLVSHGANRLTTDRRRNNALCFARTADMARLLVEGSSPSAIERGVAYTLLTSKNALGETPADLARRRLLDVQNPIGVALGQYILSFTERPAAVPHFNNLFEASTQLNPDLSPVQRHYVSRMCNLLGHSECGQDLKFHILGFLSPLDVMNE